MIHVVAHRGLWKTPAGQNTLGAVRAALDAGFGVEVDVRDWEGELVVSHDPYVPHQGGVFFQEVLDVLGDRPNVLAVNVKSCGLAPWFAECKPPVNWFFFDMAGADVESYAQNGLPYYVRHGRFEPLPAGFMMDRARGVWVDPGVSGWFPDLLPPLPFVVVSPEVRGDCYQYREDLWRSLKRRGVSCGRCTDLPEQAREFFA